MKGTHKQTRSALLEAADIPATSTSPIRWLLNWTRRGRKPVQAIPVQATASGASKSEIDPHEFVDTDEGSAAFGRWMLDSEGLPSYSYEIDQYHDPRAYYVNTEGLDRRDHWHQIGNHAVTGLAANDGSLQVYLAHRGGVFLNYSQADLIDHPAGPVGAVDVVLRWFLRFYGDLHAWLIRYRSREVITPRVVALDPTSPVAQAALLTNPELSISLKAESVLPEIGTAEDQPGFAYAGGFGYLNVNGAEVWATAYRYAPEKAKTERIFGIGYYKTVLDYRDIRQTRWVYAPFSDDPAKHNDDPVFLVEVEIENNRTDEVEIQYYEYWDVNIRQMQISWVRTGLAAPLSDNQRWQINSFFDPRMSIENNPQALRFHQEYRANSTLEGVSTREVDSEPYDVFVANLNPIPDACYVDKAAFFGSGGVRCPDVVRDRRDPEPQLPKLSGSMAYCMVLRHTLSLPAGHKVTLRYAFGAVKPGQPLSFVNQYIDKLGYPKWLARTRQAWKDRLPYFSTGGDPVLQREMTWHAYNLLASTLYSEYFDQHYSPQGSAYLYLHGAEGVPRDQSLFSMPMTYLNPELARETLTLIMGLRDADSLALPYGYVGNGALATSAAGLHAHPSDLDLFILMAVSEYLSATGDTAFLDTQIPLYRFDGKTTPVTPIPVLEHLRLAFQHLDSLGVGRHQLLKIGDGDWDDGIVIMNVLNPFQTGHAISLDNTIASGESVPNTQMALYVLPLAAAIVQKRDSAFADQMRAKAQALKQALIESKQYNPETHWFYRAYLIDRVNQPITIGDHHLSLQAQVWPIISGLADEMGITTDLVKTIKTQLDDPSPTGVMLDPNGQIWPAISQLVTWAYRRSNPELAWRSLNRQTFASHSITFPNVWHNVWSGPDGTNSKGMPNPGGTWSSPVTPMTDFPVMNSNQDAMALLALLRVCGIEPSPKGDGLDITPKAPPERFVLDMPLLRMEVDRGRVSGEYHAQNSGQVVLHIHLPKGANGIIASVDNRTLRVAADAMVVDLPLSLKADRKIPFSVRWH